MLKGKRAIITGGARGLGFETASEFVRQGADVLICARDGEALKKAADELSGMKVSDGQKVILKRADVAVTTDVDALFDHALSEFDGNLDVLVNNAGIQGPIGKFDENDWNAVVDTINVDLIGALYCMRKAVVVFKALASKEGKPSDRCIINISGGGATKARPYFMAYAVAKTGLVRATDTLAKETVNYGIRVNAIAPGAMKTRMMDEIIEAGDNAGAEYELSIERKAGGGDPLTEPACLAAFLASKKAAGITGRLISAKWDGWRELDKHGSEIEGTDLYTLRRIVPKDLGLDWE